MNKHTVCHYQVLERARVSLFLEAAARSKGRSLKVLDYGCGTGTYTRWLHAQDFDYLGVDINEEQVSRLDEEGFNVVHADGFWNGEESTNFDYILLIHLIEHLSLNELFEIVPALAARVTPGGAIVIATPTPGDRFYHDATHVRPYLPQSIRHAFGQHSGAISRSDGRRHLHLEDIWFFRDPFRTRYARSFYSPLGRRQHWLDGINHVFDLLWLTSGGRIGARASWVGVYRVIANPSAVLDA